MANTAARRGKPRYIPAADLFSVILKCHDSNGELYIISLPRGKVTVASYTDDQIRKKS